MRSSRRAHYLCSVSIKNYLVERLNVSVNIGSDDNVTKIYMSNHLCEYLTMLLLAFFNDLPARKPLYGTLQQQLCSASSR
jgi:hypothetical protein